MDNPSAPSTPSGASLTPVDYPDERLAFALGDGRVGVLSVCGRKVCWGQRLHSGPAVKQVACV